MTTRRKGRESALQILYQIEIFSQEKHDGTNSAKSHNFSNVSRAIASEAIESFFNHFEAPREVFDHATSLVHGVLLNCLRIDEIISRNSEKWKIERMALVDRNVLRIACYEFIFSPDLNSSVIIDEAVEVAKRFGSDKSAPFVNGILDSIAAETRQTSARTRRSKT